MDIVALIVSVLAAVTSMVAVGISYRVYRDDAERQKNKDKSSSHDALSDLQAVAAQCVFFSAPNLAEVHPDYHNGMVATAGLELLHQVRAIEVPIKTSAFSYKAELEDLIGRLIVKNFEEEDPSSLFQAARDLQERIESSIAQVATS